MHASPTLAARLWGLEQSQLKLTVGLGDEKQSESSDSDSEGLLES